MTDNNMTRLIDTLSTPLDFPVPVGATKTTLEQGINEKIALERSASQSNALGLPSGYHGENDGKIVRFAGMYVVYGATAPKHFRYTMMVSYPELQLRTRCIQRFRSFYVLRKLMLEALYRCQMRFKANKDAKQSGWAALTNFQTRHRPACGGCAYAIQAIKKLKFPKRKFFTTNEDIHERAALLETFLSSCLELLAQWRGCDRGQERVAVLLGKFLDVNLLFRLVAPSCTLPCDSGNESNQTDSYGYEQEPIPKSTAILERGPEDSQYQEASGIYFQEEDNHEDRNNTSASQSSYSFCISSQASI